MVELKSALTGRLFEEPVRIRWDCDQFLGGGNMNFRVGR
jgi:hypothetical protein